MLVFDPALWAVAQCASNLLSGSTLPLPPSPLSPFPVWISILYTRNTVCKGGGVYGVLGLIEIKTCRKVPLHFNFCRWRHLNCLLWVLSFYGWLKTSAARYEVSGLTSMISSQRRWMSGCQNQTFVDSKIALNQIYEWLNRRLIVLNRAEYYAAY